MEKKFKRSTVKMRKKAKLGYGRRMLLISLSVVAISTVFVLAEPDRTNSKSFSHYHHPLEPFQLHPGGHRLVFGPQNRVKKNVVFGPKNRQDPPSPIVFGPQPDPNRSRKGAKKKPKSLFSSWRGTQRKRNSTNKQNANVVGRNGSDSKRNINDGNVQKRSSFSCRGRPAGYYADMDLNCEVYHLCNRYGGGLHFNCPPGTRFQQRTMVCDHWKSVRCSDSERYFDTNLRIGHRDLKLHDDRAFFKKRKQPVMQLIVRDDPVRDIRFGESDALKQFRANRQSLKQIGPVQLPSKNVFQDQQPKNVFQSSKNRNVFKQKFRNVHIGGTTPSSQNAKFGGPSQRPVLPSRKPIQRERPVLTTNQSQRPVLQNQRERPVFNQQPKQENKVEISDRDPKKFMQLIVKMEDKKKSNRIRLEDNEIKEEKTDLKQQKRTEKEKKKDRDHLLSVFETTPVHKKIKVEKTTTTRRPALPRFITAPPLNAPVANFSSNSKPLRSLALSNRNGNPEVMTLREYLSHFPNLNVNAIKEIKEKDSTRGHKHHVVTKGHKSHVASSQGGDDSFEFDEIFNDLDYPDLLLRAEDTRSINDNEVDSSAPSLSKNNQKFPPLEFGFEPISTSSSSSQQSGQSSGAFFFTTTARPQEEESSSDSGSSSSGAQQLSGSNNARGAKSSKTKELTSPISLSPFDIRNLFYIPPSNKAKNPRQKSAFHP